MESRYFWNKTKNYFFWKTSWYSLIHFTPNKIEKKHSLEKYDWQKPHQENLTGTEAAYYPNKNKDGVKKKYSSWKE